MDKQNSINETGNLNIEACLNLLNDPEIKRMGEEYDKNKKADRKLGFNLFRLISDTYYKENLHSAILRAFLNKDEQHKCEDLFLRKFIEFLNSLSSINGNGKIDLNINEYTNTSVFCEKGRIDIQIRDNSSGKVIIIENKINNAVDQDMQLIKYLDGVQKTTFKADQKYQVDCIVYLTPTNNKEPNMHCWTEDQKQSVNKLLVKIAAYNPNEEKTLNSWIEDCKKELKSTMDQDGHVRFVFLQYQELLKQLAGQVMDMQLMEKFFEKMIDGDNFSNAMTLKSMMEDLIDYRIKNIENKFKNEEAHSPFKRPTIWERDKVVFEGPVYKNSRFKIYIVVENNNYKFLVHMVQGSITLESLLDFLNIENKGFQRVNFRNTPVMQRIFNFPKEENDLFLFINNFIEKLKKETESAFPTT